MMKNYPNDNYTIFPIRRTTPAVSVTESSMITATIPSPSARIRRNGAAMIATAQLSSRPGSSVTLLDCRCGDEHKHDLRNADDSVSFFALGQVCGREG